MSKLTEVLNRTIDDVLPPPSDHAAALKLSLVLLSESVLRLQIACALAVAAPTPPSKKRIETIAELEAALRSDAN